MQEKMSSNLDDLIQSAANLHGLSDEKLEKMVEQSDQLVLKLYDALENSKPQN
jgi:ribosome-binding protein aMBF1 (putative translation factor)